MIDALPLLLSDEGYQISRSVRLRASASAFLNRTPSVDGNRKRWTWSGWVKRGSLGSVGPLMSCTSQSGNDGIAALYFENNQLFTYYDTNTTNPAGAVGPAVYRDPSAWYHIVWAVDAANSIHYVYVNNVLVSTDTSKYPVNYDYAMNRAGYVQRIGTEAWGASNYFDGYLTEINFIDGQALTPASFGETNAVTGVWQPKKYTGTYGTNGFYLNFSDNSAATAAAIGKDYSGNGNNFTPNNISVTAGATYDSMLDVPTQWADGGNGRGNYATLNPLSKGSASTYANGNLQVVTGLATSPNFATIQIPDSGKWYWEYVGTATGDRCFCGISNSTTTIVVAYYGVDGNKYINGTGSAYGSTYTTNDVIGVAVDVDSGSITYYKNNVSQGAITQTIIGNQLFPYIADGAGGFSSTIEANFGQRPFSYTPPTGFKALNTLNLPTPTILKGNQYFDVSTWSGTGGSSRSITGVNFQPDLVWGKVRNTTYGHMLFDVVRGAGSLKELGTNVTGAEGYGSSNQYGFLSAFNSDGFTVTAGTDGTIPNAYWNQSGNTYVGWQWKEGATQGFDIVTYTGTGVAGRTVAHNLGVAPAMYILKNRGATGNWPVYHKNANANPQNGGLYLNATDAFITAAGFWNNTLPTSSVFSTGSGADTNANGNTYVAYLFAAVAGYSAFGSYTGNGSTDGPFIFTGFRPRWIMWKKTNSATNAPWVIVDTSRSPYNLAREYLLPNASDAETSVDLIDVLSNGFKWRGTAPGGNASGDTYIYAAFSEFPFKNSLAR